MKDASLLWLLGFYLSSLTKSVTMSPTMDLPLSLLSDVFEDLAERDEDLLESCLYLSGQLLFRKVGALSLFSAAISFIWGLKEAEDVLLFQFKEKEVKDRILTNGPWFYNNSMLTLDDYDDVSPLNTEALKSVPVWVSVKGLRIAMCSERILKWIGQKLGKVVDIDVGAIKRKDPIQCESCYKPDGNRFKFVWIAE